jgi:hypothetical protein
MFNLLTLAVDGHKFYSFTSSRFKREEDPAVHFRGSLSVLKTSLGVWEKRKSLPLPEIELGLLHRRPSISVTKPTELSQLLLGKSSSNRRIMLHSSLQLFQISITMKIEAVHFSETS